MDINIIKLHIHKVINSNFLFMSGVALIFGIFSLFDNRSMTLGSGFQIKDIYIRGYAFLFIIFSCELSKELCQRDKITRRIEWLLSNEVSILPIWLDYSFATWIATSLLMLPLIIFSCVKSGLGSTLTIADFYVNTLFISAILNHRILAIRNMNRYRTLSLYLFLIQFFILIIELLTFTITNSLAIGIIFRYIILTFFLFIKIGTLSKEKIVTSYY